MEQVPMEEGPGQGEVWGEVVEGVEEWAKEEGRVWEAAAEGVVRVETACAPIVELLFLIKQESRAFR